MNLDALNSKLRSHHLEFICENCSQSQNRQSIEAQTREVRVSGRGGRRIAKAKASQPSAEMREWTPVKRGKQMFRRKEENRELNDGHFPSQILSNSHDHQRQNLTFELSPANMNFPPNHLLNSNIYQQTGAKVKKGHSRQIFEDGVITPFKVADVLFPNSHKNENILGFQYKAHVFSTADARPFANTNNSEFSFDSAERQNFSNFVAFPNPPSCLQTPITLGKLRGDGPTPTQGLCFDEIPEKLNFFDNPFLEDFE
jgi:hypothetical protein